MMTKTFLSLIILCVALIPVSYGQTSTSEDSMITVVERYYREGAYLNAEVEARRFLEQQGLSDSTTVELERIIAFSLVAQNKHFAASEHFLTILKLFPAFDLDPVYTSPKIMNALNDARRRFFRPPDQRQDTVSLINSRIDQTPRLTFRAMLFPGWEQIHQGNTITGIAFAAAGGITLSLGIYYDVQRRDLRESYLSASTSTLASSRYEKYNSAVQYEIAAFAAFGLTYVLSQADLLFSFSPEMKAELTTDPATRSMLLHLQLPF